jgi:hypothetical protein
LLPVFPIIYLLFVRPYRPREVFTLLLPVVGPLLIASLLVAQGFHPLRGLNYSDYEVASFEIPSKSINLFIDGYVDGWIPFSLLSLIALTVLKWRDEKVMAFVCFLVLFIAPFVYENSTFTIAPQSRYLTNYMPLLLIPLSLVLWKFGNKVFGKNPLSFLTHVLSIILISASGAWIGSMSLPTAPRGFFESIAFVKTLNIGSICCR